MTGWDDTLDVLKTWDFHVLISLQKNSCEFLSKVQLLSWTNKKVHSFCAWSFLANPAKDIGS